MDNTNIPVSGKKKTRKVLFTLQFTSDSYSTKVKLSKPKDMDIHTVLFLVKQYLATMEVKK